MGPPQARAAILQVTDDRNCTRAAPGRDDRESMSVGMGMGGGGHGGGGQFGGMMRSIRRDDSVTQQRVTKGTTRRMFAFARPYRTILAWFLVLVIVEAVVGVINPLLFRSIINNGIEHHDKQLIIGLSLVAAGVAIVDTGLSIGIRWVSAKVGEGLIFDMRSQVFAHIQRMPLAFFTRTQTGALISRLNNDVIGAQQAFSDTLSSVVSNLISVASVLVVMFFLSWKITVASSDHPAGLRRSRRSGWDVGCRRSPASRTRSTRR